MSLRISLRFIRATLVGSSDPLRFRPRQFLIGTPAFDPRFDFVQRDRLARALELFQTAAVLRDVQRAADEVHARKVGRQERFVEVSARNGSGLRPLLRMKAERG